jgi:hypothetical protein
MFVLSVGRKDTTGNIVGVGVTTGIVNIVNRLETNPKSPNVNTME